MKFCCYLLLILGLVCSESSMSQNQNGATGRGQRIVVIDSGIFTDEARSQQRITHQWCYSRADEEVAGAPGHRDFEIVSTCQEGATLSLPLTNSNIAELPRILRHSFQNPDIYFNHVYGTRHGTTVYNELTVLSPGAEFIVLNATFYDANRGPNGSDPEDILCGVHGPGNQEGLFLPDEQQPSDSSSCYGVQQSFLNNEVVGRIVGPRFDNIAAINYSIASLNPFVRLENCFVGNSTFEIIKERHIAVVAAAGNNGEDELPVGWPACNTNVISVGALNASGRIAASTSVVGGQIDFFASGLTFDGAGPPSTSFATPKVSAAFARLQSAEPQKRTVDELKFALSSSARTTVSLGGRQIPVVNEQAVADAVECLRNDTCIDTTPPGGEELDYVDAGTFGSEATGLTAAVEEYEFGIRQGNSPIPSTFPSNSVLANQVIDLASIEVGDQVPAIRDVVLSFQVEFISGNVVDVFVNDRRVESSNQFSGSRDLEFVLDSGYFNDGMNLVRIQPRRSFNGVSGWTISDIRANYLEIVPLSLNVIDQNIYGNRLINRPVNHVQRPTGLRMSFTLDETELKGVSLSASSFNNARPDEVAVYVNGLFQGNLEGDPSQSNHFPLAENDLIEGLNIVEFVQRDNSIVIWEITDILVAVNSRRSTLQLNEADETQYGNGFGTNANPVSLEVDFVPLENHDHVLSWQAFDIDISSEVEVLLNDIPLKTVEPTGSGALGKAEAITIAASVFQPGINTMSFRLNLSSSVDQDWGITNLLVRPSTILNIDNPDTSSSVFGYYELVLHRPIDWTRTFSEEEYQTRLYATFLNTELADRTLSIQAWDVDSSDELGVYINDEFIGFLAQTPPSGFGIVEEFTLPASSLNLGVNTISLRTKDGANGGFQREKWGVRFLNSSNPFPLPPILHLLLGEEKD